MDVIEVFYMECLIRVLGENLMDKNRNQDIREICKRKKNRLEEMGLSILK